MQLSAAPIKIEQPFAAAGSFNEIPQTTGTPGAASYALGFPPITADPVSGGGIPPTRLDFNGILNNGGSVIDQWLSAGAGWPWDSAFSTAIGGYPKGARVLSADGTFYWQSIVDNNTSDPYTGGAGWIPDKRAVASVFANAAQTLAASSASKVLWNTVEQDTFGLWDATDKRFQALWAGNYRLSGSVWLPAPAAQNMSTMVYKNGTLAKLCAQFPQVSNVPLSYPFDAIVSCAVNDYLEVFMNIPTTAVTAGETAFVSPVYAQLEYLG